MCIRDRNNCITIGSTIFCDYNYLRRLRKLSNAIFVSYYASKDTSWVQKILEDDTLNLSQEDIKDFKSLKKEIKYNNDLNYLPFDKEDLLAMGQTQLQRVNKPIREYENDYIENNLGYLLNQKNMVREVMEYTIFSMVMAHEFSHIEQNLCRQTKVNINDIDKGDTVLNLSLIHISEPTRPY